MRIWALNGIIWRSFRHTSPAFAKRKNNDHGIPHNDLLLQIKRRPSLRLYPQANPSLKQIPQRRTPLRYPHRLVNFLRAISLRWKLLFRPGPHPKSNPSSFTPDFYRKKHVKIQIPRRTDFIRTRNDHVSHRRLPESKKKIQRRLRKIKRDNPLDFSQGLAGVPVRLRKRGLDPPLAQRTGQIYQSNRRSKFIHRN